MEHYLSHTDYLIWEVIQKGNGPVSVSTDTNEVIKVLPPKTAEENLARERERKARTTLLMALSEDHLAKFHKMTDAKDMLDAIKSRFGEGLHKGYDRFQSLLSQLEIHGAGVSTEDANQRFLRVFESDIRGSTGSSSSAKNVTFVSSESTSHTNDVSTANGVSTSSGYNSQRENSSSYTNEIILKKFYKKTGRKLYFDAKELVGFDKTKVECYNCHKKGHFARDCRSKGNTGYKSKDNGRRPGKQEEPKALVTLDGEGSDIEMSKRDKSGLRYGDQVHDGVLSYENEVFQSVSDNRSSDVENSSLHDRFANVEGMHAVPPPMTGNYMPLRPDREVDDYITKTLESVPEPVVVEPNVVSQPKIRPDAPIIEEYESNSDDEYVIQPSKEQERPSFAFIDTVKHVKTPRDTVKEQNTYSPSPKVNKSNWNGLMSKRLGLRYGFTKKACFVCGSFSHLIRDCDFHEKRMAKQVELNKKKGKGTGQRENRLV
ncbi:ribonuclease H-like domain-containing protein [Tanacetum coccineum]|uniref:Ribonuclease H-like domain-containing protein n=1 Tax=Tanacetum coccineum TaxID=301880 RepID=A0ABQ4X2R4_9ASTR